MSIWVLVANEGRGTGDGPSGGGRLLAGGIWPSCVAKKEWGGGGGGLRKGGWVGFI